MEARQLFSNLHHYIKDYQGNVGCVVRYDGAKVESNDYYPYGTPFTTAGAVQPYKYGAKELNRTNGLDLYDSEARWYDSLLGRTTTMDPKAENTTASVPTSGAPATETLSAGYNKEAFETVIANFKSGSYFNYPNGANSLYSSYKLGSTPTSDSLLKKYLLKKK